MRDEHKYKNLDGLRGLASLTVFFWHFSIAFLPFLVGFSIVSRSTPIDRAVSNSPLFIGLSGTFAVAVFFVLSGFVLSLSFFKSKKQESVVSAASRRYFRLMLPVLGSVIIAFLALKIFGPGPHIQAYNITGSSWLKSFWNFDANIFAALREGIYDGFFTKSSYNTNLWTMHFELFGSFLVFAFLALFGKLEKRWVFYTILSIILLQTWFLAFVFGMIIADVWVNNLKIKKIISEKYALLLLALGIVLGGRHVVYNKYENPYLDFMFPFFKTTTMEVFVLIVGAAFLIVSVLKLDFLSKILETRPLQYLGKISFSFYLLHFIVIYSFSSFMFVQTTQRLGYGIGVVSTFVASLSVSLVASHYYTKYVESPSILLSKKIGFWLTSEGQPTLSPRKKLAGLLPKRKFSAEPEPEAD